MTPIRKGTSAVEDLIACPRCHSELVQTETTVRCAKCSESWPFTLGFRDFLAHKEILPTASGGTIDLVRDAALAQELDRRTEGLPFREVLAERSTISDEKIGRRTPAETRFAKRYDSVQEEIGLAHGEAILRKIDAFLNEHRQPPVKGRWALEGAGGHGLFIPGFARRFENVVFLDCSLLNLVAARALARETGLHNISFLRGDVMSLPFRTHSFDFVHENGVIEHVTDPTKMVTEAVRVTRPEGWYVCLSPNRYPISPEPHFRLPLFGIFPPRFRRQLIIRTRGVDNEAGTDLRSLRQLRGHFRAARPSVAWIFFLAKIRRTARSTIIRRGTTMILTLPVIGTIFQRIVNGPLLSIMPYHIVIASPSSRPSDLAHSKQDVG